MIHYSCIGATGYVCGEVLRMMAQPPDGELVNVLRYLRRGRQPSPPITPPCAVL